MAGRGDLQPRLGFFCAVRLAPYVVIGVAAVAAVASYKHAWALVRAHGETGWTARLVPLTVDGMI